MMILLLALSFPVGSRVFAAEGPASAAPSEPGMAEEELLDPEDEAWEEDYEEYPELKGIADPLEPLNRAFFTFNDKLYFWLLKPVAKGYGTVIPQWGRIRVRNVFDNLMTPVRFANSLLQFKIKGAINELGRFLVNSTVGLGGMFDIAGEHPELRSSDEDLGQTLGSYGLGQGIYLVLPVLGPSSLRDAVGLAGDSFLYPVNYISPAETGILVRSADRVNETSLRLGEYEDLKESALDPYISFRDAYVQHRRSKVKE